MKTNQNTIIISLLVCIVILLIIIGGVYINGESDKVEVPTPSTQNETTEVKLDTNSPHAKTYKTIFTQEFKMPANLDNRFRVVAIGCGTSCMYLFALDKTTGKIYEVKSPSNEPFSDFTLEENHVIVKNQAGQELNYGYYPAGDTFVEFVM